MAENNEQITISRAAIRKAAHDIRNPMTSISGFAELLLEDASLEGRAREYAEVIRTETDKLSVMLDEFFDSIS